MKFGESGGAAAETCRRRRPPPQVSAAAAAAAAPHRVISSLVMKIQDKSYHVALPEVGVLMDCILALGVRWR